MTEDWRRRRPEDTDAKVSIRRARAGDTQHLARRVQASGLSDDEAAFIVALLGRARGPRGPRPDEQLAADRVDAATFVHLYLQSRGGKTESAISEAMRVFGLPRSDVYDARRRLKAEVAADPVKAAALDGLANMARRLAESGD